MNVLFLGTGTSTGVPVIGCECEVCQSSNPRDNRLRSSILIRTASTTLLIDSCPDLRQQALTHNITHVDAVLYTHEHLDHTAGFDELRAFCWAREGRLPLYASASCMEQLKRMFSWAFEESNTYQGYIRPEPHVHDGAPFTVGELEIEPLPVEHGTVETYGYLIRHAGSSFAYLPDVKSLSNASVRALRGLTAIAIDGLCYGQKQHRSHLTVEESITLLQELAPQQGIITHCGHRVPYDTVSQILPEGLKLAYDGYELNL